MAQYIINNTPMLDTFGFQLRQRIVADYKAKHCFHGEVLAVEG